MQACAGSSSLRMGFESSLELSVKRKAELCKAVESRNRMGNRMDTTWCRWRKGTCGRQEAEDVRRAYPELGFVLHARDLNGQMLDLFL